MNIKKKKKKKKEKLTPSSFLNTHLEYLVEFH